MVAKKINWMKVKGDVTVSDELDGTYYVRIGGLKFMRLPSMEMAEKSAESVRRFDESNK